MCISRGFKMAQFSCRLYNRYDLVEQSGPSSYSASKRFYSRHTAIEERSHGRMRLGARGGNRMSLGDCGGGEGTSERPHVSLTTWPVSPPQRGASCSAASWVPRADDAHSLESPAKQKQHQHGQSFLPLTAWQLRRRVKACPGHGVWKAKDRTQRKEREESRAETPTKSLSSQHGVSGNRSLGTCFLC